MKAADGFNQIRVNTASCVKSEEFNFADLGLHHLSEPRSRRQRSCTDYQWPKLEVVSLTRCDRCERLRTGANPEEGDSDDLNDLHGEVDDTNGCRVR